jgi:hypothetical protein
MNLSPMVSLLDTGEELLIPDLDCLNAIVEGQNDTL